MVEQPNGVLSGSAIRALVDARELLVGPQDPDYRGAAINLRIAPEFMILPDGTRVWPGNHDERKRRREGALRLAPSDVAFVSTMERFKMPWNLAGNIAVRFRLEERGIAVQGGLLVDPGYGCTNEDEGERLHFQIANIAEKAVEVDVGEPIAALQVFRVEGDAKATTKDGKPPTSADKIKELFNNDAAGPLPQLSFYPDMRKTERDLKELEAQLDSHRRHLEQVEKATDRLVVFGVFVIAATLFTVAVAAILSALAEGGSEEVGQGAQRVVDEPPDLWVILVIVGSIAVLALVLLFPLYRYVRRDWGNKISRDA